jgi:hypothetical protein
MARECFPYNQSVRNWMEHFIYLFKVLTAHFSTTTLHWVRFIIRNKEKRKWAELRSRQWVQSLIGYRQCYDYIQNNDQLNFLFERIAHIFFKIILNCLPHERQVTETRCGQKYFMQNIDTMLSINGYFVSFVSSGNTLSFWKSIM